MSEGDDAGALGARHRGREAALQVLFALDVQAHVRSGEVAREMPSAETVFEEIAANFEMPDRARAFASELVFKSIGLREQLDVAIREQARNWRIERMAVVDRNVLRLATYELSHTDTPTPVILDEAVELARRFGADPSPAFVNGILDAIAAKLRGPVE